MELIPLNGWKPGCQTSHHAQGSPTQPPRPNFCLPSQISWKKKNLPWVDHISFVMFNSAIPLNLLANVSCLVQSGFSQTSVSFLVYSWWSIYRFYLSPLSHCVNFLETVYVNEICPWFSHQDNKEVLQNSCYRKKILWIWELRTTFLG